MTLPSPLALGWRAMPGISLRRDGPTGVVVGRAQQPPVALRTPTPVLAEMLTAIEDGLSEADLLARLDVAELARFGYHVGRLVAHGIVAVDVLHHGDRLVTLRPRRRGFQLPTSPWAGGELELSRFAQLRRVGTDLVLAATDASCDVEVADPRAQQWVTACARPQPADGATERPALLQLLHGVGLLTSAGAAEAPGMRTWELHDRVFHRATRSYDDHRDRGASYRWRGLLDSPPPTRAPYAGTAYGLSRPGPDHTSQPLRTVMEARRSSHDMSGEPVTSAEVGELLHRVARTTERGDGPDPYVRRPYPSAGSRHELEFYLAVGSCRDLDPDFYHYRGDEHALVALSAPTVAATMLTDCAVAWGQPDHPPQVLVVISSRLPRLAWKYEAIAYRLSLLNAGAAIANLYLVTTDMGLAGCAAGSGNPELFAAATGSDPWEETSIAEFGLGRAGG